MQVTDQRIERWAELIYTEHRMECFIPTTTSSSNDFTVGAVWTLREVSEDAYLERHGVSDTVRRKSPEDDCYVLMPMELGWQPPDSAVGFLAMLVERYWMASKRGSQPPPLSWVAKRFPVSRLCLLEGRKMATRLCVCVFGSHGIGDALSRMIQVPRDFQQQKTTPFVSATYKCVRMLFVIWQRTHLHRRHVDRFGRMQPGPQCESRLEKTFIAGS